jgi:hypothetical protein
MKKLTAIKFSPLSGEIILPDNSKLSFARLDKEKFQLRIVVKWEHEKNFKLSISDFPTQLLSVNKDIGILDEFDVSLVGSSRQRTSCLCPSNKVQIIRTKPRRCHNKCIYCYWRD